MRSVRRSTLNETIQVYSVQLLDRSLWREALALPIALTLIDGFTSLMGGRDLRFSWLLLEFVIEYAFLLVLFFALRAYGRRLRVSGKY